MSEEVKSTRRQALKDFSILVLLLGSLTLIFRFTNLDIRLEHFFYSTAKGWELQYHPFWDLIYRYGIFPGYFMAFAGLILISLSYWNSRYLQFRRASLVLVFTLIVGPGLLVNLVLKDHTGRPRPREITEFGGTENYLCVCQKGDTNDGKSFPCGHCSMGFYLAIPYLFYRGRKKIAARAFLVTGLVYGILIGIARMMAGGHFASDVVWAGGLTWGIALAGFYIFRPDKPLKIPEYSGEEQKKRARRATVIVGILLPVITIGLMLATPYFSTKYFDLTRNQLDSVQCKIFVADLKDASVIVRAGKDLHLDYKVNAFGFPNSKIRGILTMGDTSRYTVQHLGWFTEVKNTVNIVFPAEEKIEWQVRVDHGRIFLDLPDSCNADFHFFIGKGDVRIRSKTGQFILAGKSDQVKYTNRLRIPCFSRKPLNREIPVISFDLKDGSVIIE